MFDTLTHCCLKTLFFTPYASFRIADNTSFMTKDEDDTFVLN
jgi:hypothetical protein